MIDRRLSIKEKRFLQKYLEGKPLYECAKFSGCKSDDRAYLSNIGYLIKRKLDISMPEVLEMSGVTDEILATKIQEALEAEKKYFGTWQGEVIESKAYSDHAIRLKAVEIAGKMKGHFIDRTELTGRDGGDLVLEVVPASRRVKGSNLELDFDE